jgi:hypothetical protein
VKVTDRHATVDYAHVLKDMPRDIATGKVIGECLARHRADEFLAFLKKIDRETPTHLDLI